MDESNDQLRIKRFKHQSYNATLKEVHPAPAHNQAQLDENISDNDSHFHQALNHWRQLNLAPSFITFANKVESLSASMPLLLHNWKEIIAFWLEALEVADDEGLTALLDLLQKITHDLRTTFSPMYDALLQRLLKLLSRQISASSLTALLETFSVLFKLLLVPSEDAMIIERTWTALRLALPNCLAEIQRAVAEVWGSVLRRLKLTTREEAIRFLAENTEGVEDASAWAVVAACKSVSQTLHTTAPSIVTSLLNFNLSTDKPETTYTLIRRVLTALIHHVKNAEQFSPLAEILVTRFSSVTKSQDGTLFSIETIRRIVEIVIIPSAVRQGSRLTQNQLSILLTQLSTIPLLPELLPSLLKLSVSVFTASDMSLWLGPAREYLQYVWTKVLESRDKTILQFCLRLNACLVDLGWGGWKLVGLPLFLKMTANMDVVDLDPSGVLELMAVFKSANKLNIGDTDIVWRGRVEKWTLDRLKSWDQRAGDGSIAELGDILSLSELFSTSFTPVIVDMVQNCLATPQDALGNYNETPSNSSHVLSLCFRALKKRDPSEWSGVDLQIWIRTCVEYWGWSQEVLGGLVSLIQKAPASEPSIPIEDIYPQLRESLLSHHWKLRLAALRLLGSSIVRSPPGTYDVIRRCLQGEEVSIDVQGVRERVLRIGRVEQIIRDGDELGAEVASRWMIAQLKVNLRPLWSPAAGALSSISGRFGDLLWRTLFSEVQGVGEHQTASPLPSWMYLEDEVDRDPWEEERSWRDPAARKLREVVTKWLNIKRSLLKIIQAQQPSERLDWRSYEYQLLATLGECSSLVEKHNRELVPHFLALGGPDAAAKLPKQKLIAWLTLFSKLSNPKALYMTDSLYTFYLSVLSHPDRSLQTVALRCVFTYKPPSLAIHEEKLFALLDENRWREELTSLDLNLVESPDRSAFVDIVIRLLFGVMLERKGRSRGNDRRAAVLGTLGGCTDEELGLLVELMLRPLHSTADARRDQPFSLVPVDTSVSRKQQSGFLTLLGDVLKNLGPKLVAYWPALIGTTVDLIANAQKSLEHLVEDGDELADEEEDVEDVDDAKSGSKIMRSIRQMGLRRLADFFRSPMLYDFAPYMPACFTSFISPRLAALDKENTQAPSALLELFYSWCSDTAYIKFFVDHDTQVLSKIYDCLVAPSVKPSVTSRVFDIVDRLLAASATDIGIQESVLKPHVSLLLRNLSTLMQHTRAPTAITSPLVQRQINILSEVAHYSTDSTQATILLELFTPLLKRPSKFVPEKVKANLLKIAESLLPLIPDLSDKSSKVYQSTYRLLSQLLQSLRSRQARLSLISALQKLSTIDGSLRDLASLVEALNAFSSKHIGEPDFDIRMATFARLNETGYKTFTASDWLPLLYNMLYFLQDPLELAIRSNASFTLRHFIDLVAVSPASEYEATFSHILFPGLKNGLRSKNELVRAEVLGVIAYAVEKCNQLAPLQEMKVLLADGDEEANFFNNILHIQVHRRLRALRRLADYCDEGHLRSRTLAEIFVPLVGNYISSTASTDHHLVNEAILTSGRMAKHLAWGAYFALVQKYLKLSRAKDESERVYVRTLVALLDSFHFPMEQVVHEIEYVTAEGENDDEVDGDCIRGEVQLPPPVDNTLSAQQTAKIVDAVNLRLLPDLLSHLEKRDPDTNDNVRIPISIGIISVAKHLPTAAREPQIVRLLIILCQILRSRSQETRDLSRDALTRIAVSLGPSYLPHILRELRGALTRGTQLHVLAYIVHSLLAHVTSGDHATPFEILDDCVNDIAYISAEVIFGESGKDVQAEGFQTKMREVHSSASKGLDSFAIASRFITPPKISSLLAPLKSIMEQTASTKVMNLVEEVLRRVAGGLNSNKHLVTTELLVLCNTLITQNARFLKQTPARRKPGVKRDAIVQTKRQEAVKIDHFANNSFRFVAFGLELLNTALRRNRFDFHDKEVTSRLDAMTIVVGNTLYSTNTPVIVLGVKAAASLSKCPLQSLEKAASAYARQILDIMQQIGNTESEVVQVALKSLATLVRDCPTAQVKEKDLVYLLGLLSPDLEDPDRQTSVFSMLRAIIARKFVVPEIYDIMEKVSEVMVTSQSTQVQELCRGVLLQFLLDYPQGKGRLQKQMAFFAKNLSYTYESGRKSVMEILSAVMNKFQVDLVYEYSDLLFIALVMVVANDDSAKCREMAAVVIKSLFTRLDEDRRKLILSHVHSWAGQQTQLQLARVSSQVYGFVIDVLEAGSLPYVTSILEDLSSVLIRSGSDLSSAEARENDDTAIAVDLDWQVSYHALTVIAKILRFLPNIAADEHIPWHLVASHLLFPHAWVRTAACRLLGSLFSASPPAPPSTQHPDTHPLSNAGMRDVANRFCSQLKSEHLDEALGLQVVKNLFYIGKCFYAMPALEDAPLEDLEEGDKAGEDLKQRNPLPWLFSKLSYQIKSAHIAKRNRTSSASNWAQQPLSILRWFAAMTSYMEAVQVEKFLVHILTPVYRILEDDTIRDAQLGELKTVATELQDLLQNKVGTTQFSTTYNQIRQGTLGVRRDRKAVKATKIVTNPEAAAKRKMQKNAIKKESRKRKNQSFAERQGKLKRRRAEE